MWENGREGEIRDFADLVQHVEVAEHPTGRRQPVLPAERLLGSQRRRWAVPAVDAKEMIYLVMVRAAEPEQPL